MSLLSCSLKLRVLGGDVSAWHLLTSGADSASLGLVLRGLTAVARWLALKRVRS
jgi:hypothetical protein